MKGLRKRSFYDLREMYDFPPRGKIYPQAIFCLKRCYGNVMISRNRSTPEKPQHSRNLRFWEGPVTGVFGCVLPFGCCLAPAIRIALIFHSLVFGEKKPRKTTQNTKDFLPFSTPVKTLDKPWKNCRKHSKHQGIILVRHF